MSERRIGAPGSGQAKRGERKRRREQVGLSQSSGSAPAQRPWSVPFAVSDIPEAGQRVELTADAATRLAIAKAAGLVALPRLEAVFDLMRLPGEGARVDGHVSATVEQN